MVRVEATTRNTCNQISILRESELRIKHGTEVVDTNREGYVRAEKRENARILHSWGHVQLQGSFSY